MNLVKTLADIRNFLAPVLILVISFVLASRVIMPKIEEIGSLRQSIKEQEKEAADLASYLSYLEELAKSPLEIEESIVNYALPQEKDAAALIITYEGLSKIEKVAVDPLTIQPGVITEEKKSGKQKLSAEEKKKILDEPQEIEFKMSAKGEEMEALKKLLNAILETRRILEIKKISLKFEEEAVGLDASIVAYYFPNPKPKTGAKRLDEVSYQETVNKIFAARAYESEVLTPVELGKTDLFFPEEKSVSSSTASAKITPAI